MAPSKLTRRNIIYKYLRHCFTFVAKDKNRNSEEIFELFAKMPPNGSLTLHNGENELAFDFSVTKGSAKPPMYTWILNFMDRVGVDHNRAEKYFLLKSIPTEATFYVIRTSPRSRLIEENK